MLHTLRIFIYIILIKYQFLHIRESVFKKHFFKHTTLRRHFSVSTVLCIPENHFRSTKASYCDSNEIIDINDALKN
jgi:hypothetical protein